MELLLILLQIITLHAMTLKRIVHVKEDVIISNRIMFRTIPGGGLVVRDHSIIGTLVVR